MRAENGVKMKVYEQLHKDRELLKRLLNGSYILKDVVVRSAWEIQFLLCNFYNLFSFCGCVSNFKLKTIFNIF